MITMMISIYFSDTCDASIPCLNNPPLATTLYLTWVNLPVALVAPCAIIRHA